MDNLIRDGTDIYGLGAALFHLITLERPWHFLPSVKKILICPPPDRKQAITEAIKTEVDIVMLLLPKLYSRDCSWHCVDAFLIFIILTVLQMF